MHSLSEDARIVIDSMEVDRPYNVQDLQALVPGASVERLRETMHELWIGRQVERTADGGWRRARSEPPHRRDAVPRESGAVQPEDLFDYAAFTDFFK